MFQALRAALRRYRRRRLLAGFKARGARVASGVQVTEPFTHRLHPAAEVTVGAHTVLAGRIVVTEGGHLRIGQHCSFRAGTYLGCKQHLWIGDHVFGAEGVYVSDNNNHPTSPAARRAMTLAPPNAAAWKWNRADVDTAGVVIEDDVWLGRHCMILKGVTIGRGSIVAAGAVVTRSAPPFSVLAGNPARVVKTLPNDLDAPGIASA